MKKYVSLFLIILCLFTQNVSATTSKNNDTFTIDQNTLDDNQSLSLDVDIQLSSLLSQEVIHRDVTIRNEFPYDLQLTQVKLEIPDELNTCLSFGFQDERDFISASQKYQISQYLDIQSETYQQFNDFIKKQRISSLQQTTLSFQYLLNELSQNTSLSVLHIHFEFMPIMYQGYVFQDLNRTGIMDDNDIPMAGVKVNLWQNENLIATTSTSKDGYYQFVNQKEISQGYLEVEEQNGLHLTKCMKDKELGNSFEVTDGKMITPLSTDSRTQNAYIGFVKNTFKIHYHANGGQNLWILDQQGYETKAQAVVLGKGSLERKNYEFVGWNTAPDGSGITYQEGQNITVATHDITLYAVWKKQEPIVKIEEPKVPPVSLFEVQTSDETPLLILSLLCLSAFGGIIVAKALKKKESR